MSEALGWLFVVAQALRCLVHVIVFAHVNRLEIVGVADSNRVRMHRDLNRWRRVAGVDAVHHALVGALLSIPLLSDRSAPLQGWVRIALGVVAVVAVAAIVRATWCTMVKHRRVYRSWDAALRETDEIRASRP